MPLLDPFPADTAIDAPPPIRVRPKPRTDPKTKRQPPHAVILYNDDINGFDFVIGVLRKVLRVSGPRAFWLTLKAHLAGRTIVWTGTLEVAELKADQVRSCGPKPRKIKDGAQPLKTSIEPLAE